MIENKQQTAVQWFLDQLIEHRIIIVNKTTYQVKYKHEILLEQAKEMEKEQIENAFEQGENNSVDYFNPGNRIKESEQYYIETYGGNK
jgi:hypothetical protein